MKCSNKDCPYGLEAYDEKRKKYKGLCLNCWDDEQEPLDETWLDNYTTDDEQLAEEHYQEKKDWDYWHPPGKDD